MYISNYPCGGTIWYFFFVFFICFFCSDEEHQHKNTLFEDPTILGKERKQISPYIFYLHPGPHSGLCDVHCKESRIDEHIDTLLTNEIN